MQNSTSVHSPHDNAGIIDFKGKKFRGGEFVSVLRTNKQKMEGRLRIRVNADPPSPALVTLCIGDEWIGLNTIEEMGLSDHDDDWGWSQ